MLSPYYGTYFYRQVSENPKTDWIEGVAILIAVFIVVMVTAVNDMQKEKQFKELQGKQVCAREVCVAPRSLWLILTRQDEQKIASVIRDGVQQVVNTADLVVGDVMILAQGAIIAADGVLVCITLVFARGTV
jgi:magnesium-transporting ATPase (P-type)